MGLRVILRTEIAKVMRNALLAGEYLPGERVPLEAFARKWRST